MPLLEAVTGPTTGPHEGITSRGGNDGLGAPGALHDINNGLGDSSDWLRMMGFGSAQGTIFPNNVNTGIVGLIVADQGTLLNRLNSANTSTIAGINSANFSTFGENIAAPVTDPNQFDFIYPYNIMLTLPIGKVEPVGGSLNGTQFQFGFDFSNYSDSSLGINAGDITVLNVLALPEPGSVGLVVTSSIGLLLRRRR